MSDKELIEQLANKIEETVPHDISQIAFSLTAEQLEAFAKAYAQTQGQSNWQPIETAPKDGTEVLLLSTNSKRDIAMYCNGVWLDGYSNDVDPTHWMPLPSAVKE